MERLPGFGRIRRSRWRNERKMDGVAQMLREVDQYDPLRQALVTLGRTTAASLDRLEHDELRSEHVLANVARVHHQILQSCDPGVSVTADAFDRLLDDLSTPVLDPSPT